MRFPLMGVLVALCSVGMPAHGQHHVHPTSAQGVSSCEPSQERINSDFFGVWVLELRSVDEANAPSTRLVFKRNPEFAQSLAGEFDWRGSRMEVFGDIEAGQLELEESSNGKDISGLWVGRVVQGSCGQLVVGTRKILATQMEQSFVLRRPGRSSSQE
jgi:hypothetical protein